VNRNVHVGTFSKGGQARNYAMVPTPGTLLELLHATVQSKVKGAPAPTLSHMVILHTSRLGTSLAADKDLAQYEIAFERSPPA
jgi:hypothetical protein